MINNVYIFKTINYFLLGRFRINFIDSKLIKYVYRSWFISYILSLISIPKVNFYIKWTWKLEVKKRDVFVGIFPLRDCIDFENILLKLLEKVDFTKATATWVVCCSFYFPVKLDSLHSCCHSLHLQDWFLFLQVKNRSNFVVYYCMLNH